LLLTIFVLHKLQNSCLFPSVQAIVIILYRHTATCLNQIRGHLQTFQVHKNINTKIIIATYAMGDFQISVFDTKNLQCWKHTVTLLKDNLISTTYNFVVCFSLHVVFICEVVSSSKNYVQISYLPSQPPALLQISYEHEVDF
jgi:hypothetical protein